MKQSSDSVNATGATADSLTSVETLKKGLDLPEGNSKACIAKARTSFAPCNVSMEYFEADGLDFVVVTALERYKLCIDFSFN